VINYYKHSEIDKEKWNTSIRNSLSATIFADFDFLSLANPSWGALIQDDYEVVMPLPHRAKVGIHYILTPYFFSRLGIFSSKDITNEQITDFIQTIPHKFWQVDLNLNEQNASSVLASKSVQLTSYQLDLNAPYLAIYGNYSENLRRNLRTAQKYSLVIDKNADIQEIIALFRHNRGKIKTIKMKSADYNLFLKMAEMMKNQDKIDVWGVRDEQGNLLAGACLLKDYQRTWFWFSGRDERYAEKRAMFFLLDEYFKQHAGNPLLFDFNGSMNENIARFYSQFGSQKYTYPMLCYSQRIYLSPLIKFYKLMKL